jgi:hypothetical protein
MSFIVSSCSWVRTAPDTETTGRRRDETVTRRVKLGAIAAAGVLGLGIVGAGVGQSVSNANSARYYQGFQASTTALTSKAMAPGAATIGQGASGQVPVQKASQAFQQTGGASSTQKSGSTTSKSTGAGTTGTASARGNGTNGG